MQIDLTFAADDIQAGTEIPQKPCPGIVITSNKLVVQLYTGQQKIPVALIFFNAVRQCVKLVQEIDQKSVGMYVKGKNMIDQSSETLYIKWLRAGPHCVFGINFKSCERKIIKSFTGRRLRLEKSGNRFLPVLCNSLPMQLVNF